MSPPSAFGTYRVLHQIGSGVLGPVFRAYDSQHDRLVAIKTFKLDLVPEDAARLADQLRALADKLPAHPAIVGAVEAGLQGSVPFIALEYASGESLDVVMRQSGPSPLSRALPVLREIARAIDASWAVPVGHGALHPRDIFVTTGTTDVRITGFGIGQALEAMGSKAPVRRPYSAPERATGSAWDARADVYSFGAITAEMLFGKQPVASGDSSENAVRRALAMATAERPGDRYETAKAFVDALVDAAAVEVPDSPKRASRIRRPRPIVLNLPLLADADADARDEKPDTAPVARPIEAVAAAEAEVAAVPVRKPAPMPEPAPEPKPAAIPLPPPIAPRRVAPAPQPVLESVRTRIAVDEPWAVAPEPDAAPFPWAALVAAIAASLVVGSVVAYQIGWNRGNQAARPLVTATPIAPAPTVAAPPPPIASPTAPSPVATPAARATDPPATVPDAAPKGRLVIQSVPSGALVTVDGRRVGETPVTVPVSFGRHEIQVARPGYVPKTQSVDVTARSPSRQVRVQLRRGSGVAVAAVPGTGTVDVDSRPRGARVTVDGRFVGATPIRVPELTIGDHRVQIDLAGHKPVTSTVNIVGGAIAKVQVTLEQGELKMLDAQRIVR